MLSIEQRRSVKYDVKIDVKSRYECDNCGHIVEHAETINASDFGDMFLGETAWCEIDCPECGDRLISCGFTDPNIVIDLTKFQGQMSNDNAHMIDYITPKR